MIEIINVQGSEAQSQNGQAAQHQSRRKVFRMTTNDRTAGSMPSWDAPKTPKQQVMQNLASATDPATDDTFESALALHNPSQDVSPNAGEEFGFGDLIDMVNPLHHIPVVGHVYRELTGDEIKPIGKIIGGGIFGGPAGVASGLVNTVIESETGDDLAGNAMNIVLNGKKPEFKSMADHPEKRLNETLESLEGTELPGSALSFADLGSAHKFARKTPEKHIENYTSPAAAGRTAGTIMHEAPITQTQGLSHTMPAREPITIISLSDLPRRQNL